MEQEFQKAEGEVDIEMEQEKEANVHTIESFWEKAMKQYNPEDPDMMEKLQSEWKDIIENWDTTENAMQKHWQVASDIEELQYSNMKHKYAFNNSNPHANHANPHLGFVESVSKGDTPNAILFLEAHLQKNETDSDAWRMLGIQLQENDQDQKSCSALLNSLKQNPDDLAT